MTEIIEILQEIETHVLVFGWAIGTSLGFIALILGGIRRELKKLAEKE